MNATPTQAAIRQDAPRPAATRLSRPGAIPVCRSASQTTGKHRLRSSLCCASVSSPVFSFDFPIPTPEYKSMQCAVVVARTFPLILCKSPGSCACEGASLGHHLIGHHPPVEVKNVCAISDSDPPLRVAAMQRPIQSSRPVPAAIQMLALACVLCATLCAASPTREVIMHNHVADDDKVSSTCPHAVAEFSSSVANALNLLACVARVFTNLFVFAVSKCMHKHSPGPSFSS